MKADSPKIRTIAFVTVIACTIAGGFVATLSFDKRSGIGTGGTVYASVSLQDGHENYTNPAYTAQDVSRGWLQLASFVKYFSPLPPAINGDPDWVGAWRGKPQIGLDSGNNPQCLPPITWMGGVPRNNSGVPAVDLLGREFPVQLRISTPSGLKVPSDCSGIFQVVFYNEVAADYIQGNYPQLPLALNQKANLNKILTRPGAKIEFPDKSVVIKTLWEPVTSERPTIVIWDPGLTLFSQPTGGTFPRTNLWPTVSIKNSNDPCNQNHYQTSRDPRPNPTLPQMQVPISCFVHRQLGNMQYVLVGLNVAHKRPDGWYWYEFAWTNNLTASIAPAIQNPQLKSLSHYVMNFTDTYHDPLGQRTCYNPYLEGLGLNGPKTNCIRCHQFATYVNLDGNSGDIPLSGTPVKIGINGTHGASITPTSDDDLNTFRTRTLPTDFLWSLVTAQHED